MEKKKKSKLYRIHAKLKKAGNDVFARQKTVYIRVKPDEKIEKLIKVLIDAGYGVTNDMFL